jgi:hypothetical protein
MSSLEEQCHIDKGAYTDGPVLTAGVRMLFERIESLQERNAELEGAIRAVFDANKNRRATAIACDNTESEKERFECVRKSMEALVAFWGAIEALEPPQGSE